jgi:hypothetical protein
MKKVKILVVSLIILLMAGVLVITSCDSGGGGGGYYGGGGSGGGGSGGGSSGGGSDTSWTQKTLQLRDVGTAYLAELTNYSGTTITIRSGDYQETIRTGFGIYLESDYSSVTIQYSPSNVKCNGFTGFYSFTK